MESALTKACKIKINNFEGPFDLLFHLIEKNQFNIYDIPINTITDQYMDYLFAMQEMDLEIASEFLVMASTLLHIKSKMLLPSRKEEQEQEEDPREELVLRLLEYRKYKDFSNVLREREKEWSKVCWKLPEVITLAQKDEIVEMIPDELKRVYTELLERNRKKMNPNVNGINRIIQHEKVSMRSKMREIIRELIKKGRFRFSELFSFKKRSLADVVTGFLAILELAKLRRIRLEQRRIFGEIYVSKTETAPELGSPDARELDSMA
ncbi:MAG: segregation/condensation protein A [Acetivibrionales bacterium]|nr:segregation/condensation protein A [Bacillota bacterium]NLP07001.1 segregation/condensation protein A [Clostridiaceae bacterium]HOA54976.1 segregation/condensation protein A [Clostridiales bacterium]HQD31516.1 segregation/condensation protein A [Clostridiales bacterium]